MLNYGPVIVEIRGFSEISLPGVLEQIKKALSPLPSDFTDELHLVSNTSDKVKDLRGNDKQFIILYCAFEAQRTRVYNALDGLKICGIQVLGKDVPFIMKV